MAAADAHSLWGEETVGFLFKLWVRVYRLATCRCCAKQDYDGCQSGYPHISEIMMATGLKTLYQVK